MLLSGSWWRVSANCRRCRAQRLYLVRSDGRDLLGPAFHTGYLQLGGPEPSTVLTAGQLAADIERLAPDITLDPAVARDGEGAERNLSRLGRLQTALTELAKFIPAGAGEVPGLAARAHGAAVPHVRPARYTRDWISGELAYWKPLGFQLPRIPPHPRPGPLPNWSLGRAHGDAHRDWLRRGRTGAGQLVLAGVDLGAASLGGQDFTGSRWERVLARRSDLRFCALAESELTDVDFAQAAFDHAQLTGARLTRCTLDGSALGLTVLDGALLADCSLERLHTRQSSWRGAVVRRSRLRLSDFRSSRLDGAQFTDCDLREAWFAPGPGRSSGTSAGAVFERCDLRDADFTGRDLAGVTFAGCRFRGATGLPAATQAGHRRRLLGRGRRQRSRGRRRPAEAAAAGLRPAPDGRRDPVQHGPGPGPGRPRWDAASSRSGPAAPPGSTISSRLAVPRGPGRGRSTPRPSARCTAPWRRPASRPCPAAPSRRTSRCAGSWSRTAGTPGGSLSAGTTRRRCRATPSRSTSSTA